MSATGKWSEGWQIGDIIEANVTQSQWTGKDGFPHTTLKLENPVPSTFQPGAGGGKKFYPSKSKHIDYYTLAIQALPYVSPGKTVNLDFIHDFALAIKSRIETLDAQSAPVEAAPVTQTAAPVQTQSAFAAPISQPAGITEEIVVEDLKPF